MISRSIDNYIIFRMSNVFGLGNQANLTAINSWIVDSQKGNDLVIWGPGHRKIQYIFINDVISILLQCQQPISGLYNLGSNDYLSMAETSLMISKKYSVNVENLLNKNEGATLPFMSIKKLGKNFKVPIFTSFRDMLESIK